MHRIGFDSDQYVEMQSRHIAQRRSEFGGKLYLEFGGKLIDDMHASRVLPGFTPDNKVRMLRELADEVEIIVAVNAKDFARRKVRADMGTTYDDEVLRQIDEFRERGLYVGSVVITQWTDDNKAAAEVKMCIRDRLKDESFAKGMLGPGIGIEPADGLVVAPFDGTVTVAFPTGHAYGLKSASGVQVLIHVGTDTVKLDGKGFTPRVAKGDVEMCIRDRSWRSRAWTSSTSSTTLSSPPASRDAWSSPLAS